uniref:Uncharacterized protein n=1 Tax=Acanthochromis polyacanthus TaxID=80966 RepID=A0A3Q1G5V1_9TELE
KGKSKLLLGDRKAFSPNQYKCSPSAVGFILQKYRPTNSLEDKPRSGRPRQENHRMTSQELQQQWSNQTGVQCSICTARGRLLDHAHTELDRQELEEDSVVR